MCLTTTSYADKQQLQDDDLIEYLAIEYPSNAPFDKWDVLGISTERDACSWAPTAQLPLGSGLRLGSTGGDSLRLGIEGLQFADHDDPRRRNSWYLVEGAATQAGHPWEFSWQALTGSAPPLIVAWLLQLADWVATNDRGARPEPPWLVEPNLQFRAARVEQGRAVIVVELGHEFANPQGDGAPTLLTVHTTVEELRQAAIDFAASVANHPTDPVASRPVGVGDLWQLRRDESS